MKIVDQLVSWVEERTGLVKPVIDMAKHLVPPGSKWFYVFGTAIMSSFLVQVVTGIGLMSSYIPSAGQAYESIKYITSVAPFGNLIRAMHYFGASSMVIFVFIHMIRVYLMGSYKFPREIQWLSGVALLFFTIVMGFTGQVLRWDQNAVWTIAVGAEQALRAPFVGKFISDIIVSGGMVSSSTLGHFFVVHVFLLPGLLIGAIGLHVYLVLRNGISEPPKVGEAVDPKTYVKKYHAMLQRDGKPFWPDAAWRDIVFSTIVVTVIFILAIGFGAPAIEKPPDPSLVNASPRPDWYLVWYFALLAFLPHRAEDFVIIAFPVFLGVSLLAVPFINNKGERSPSRRPWAIAIVLCSLAAVSALTYLGFTEPWTPKFEASKLTPEIIGASSGPIYDGAQVFDTKGCLYCHTISGHGGKRGPDLTEVGNRLTHEQVIVRIVGGGYNMPAYAGNITPKELSDVADFLVSRKAK
ncbi:MAG: cytochrome b N-terminal domain-containing protein [Cyanobacteria bacterium REEB67]|nr:cytochrome b N-terminal domain-containing protein [Cyanobacteria bacterium REEB67]